MLMTKTFTCNMNETHMHKVIEIIQWVIDNEELIMQD